MMAVCQTAPSCVDVGMKKCVILRGKKVGVSVGGTLTPLVHRGDAQCLGLGDEGSEARSLYALAGSKRREMELAKA